MIVYRIQPQGADLHGVDTETSNGESAGGVHVFGSVSEIAACYGWITELNVEVATIECNEDDVSANGDYEGDLLLSGRGRIIERKPFADTRAVAAWAENPA